jgi:hypothetical protein
MSVPLLEEVSHPAFPRVAPHLVTTEQELREVVSYFMAHPAFVLDVETTIAPTPALNEVLWIGLATYGKVALIPIGHPHGPKITPEFKYRVDRETRTGVGRGDCSANLALVDLDPEGESFFKFCEIESGHRKTMFGGSPSRFQGRVSRG